MLKLLQHVVISLAALVVGDVFAGTRAVTAADEASLRNVLRERYPEVERWEITPTHRVRFKRLSTYFARLESGRNVYRDGNLFAIQSGNHLGRYIVTAERQVMVAQSFAAKGNNLKVANAALMLHDAFALNCEPISSSAESTAMRLRRNVRSGDVICRVDVEGIPLVSKHDQVLLQCKWGEVQVSVMAEALGEGGLGNVIKVRRDNPNTVVVATVTGRGEVNACI